MRPILATIEWKIISVATIEFLLEIIIKHILPLPQIKMLFEYACNPIWEMKQVRPNEIESLMNTVI